MPSLLQSKTRVSFGAWFREYLDDLVSLSLPSGLCALICLAPFENVVASAGPSDFASQDASFCRMSPQTSYYLECFVSSLYGFFECLHYWSA